MSEIKLEKQEILTGSSRLTNRKRRSFDRINYMLKYMEFNKAYIYKVSNNDDKQKPFNTLEQFKKRYIDYRKNWTEASNNFDNVSNFDSHLSNLSNPLSVDIETASICDLACPHCSREYIITPDKLMNFDLYKILIKEVSDLEIPSIKFH